MLKNNQKFQPPINKAVALLFHFTFTLFHFQPLKGIFLNTTFIAIAALAEIK